MIDSRLISLDELNNLIDKNVREYESSAEECFQELDSPERGDQYLAKVEALTDLKIEISEPTPIVNVSENVQQTSNVITTQNIVNDEL